MALQHLTSAPKAEDFTPLHEHQEQTPSTFFGSKPVLYARYSDLTLAAPKAKIELNSAFSKFTAASEEHEEDLFIKNVEIWVNSADLILFQNDPSPTGVSIPFPSIALHATMKWKSRVEALYTNISLNDVETVNNDEDIETLELTVLPPNYAATPDTTCIKEIFSAMNACADLHPDPNSSEAEDEEDEAAPGATGWITADNMDEYLDEDGNFRGSVIGDASGNEQLGPGAGTVRQREEDEQDHVNGVNGDGAEGETKWQRTD